MKCKSIDIDGLVAAIKCSRKKENRKNPVKQMVPAGVYAAALSAVIRLQGKADFEGLKMAFSGATDDGGCQVPNWTGRFGFDSKGQPLCQLFPMDGDVVITKYSVQIKVKKG